MRLKGLVGLAAACATAVWALPLAASAQGGVEPRYTSEAMRATLQAAPQTLGTVRLTRAVAANGEPLAAGTYTVRLSADPVTPVVGQSPDASRWVEFVQAGRVKGKELATVIPATDIAQIAKRGKPPAAGTARVEMLKGGEYLRVWINHAGMNYLVHLSIKAGS